MCAVSGLGYQRLHSATFEYFSFSAFQKANVNNLAMEPRDSDING